LLREQAGHQHGGGGAQGSVPESDAPYGYVGAVKAEPPKPAAAQAPQNKTKQKRLRAAANRAERGEPPKHGGAWAFVTDPICNFDIQGTKYSVSFKHRPNFLENNHSLSEQRKKNKFK
jgi:hypothetical protein